MPSQAASTGGRFTVSVSSADMWSGPSKACIAPIIAPVPMVVRIASAIASELQTGDRCPSGGLGRHGVAHEDQNDLRMKFRALKTKQNSHCQNGKFEYDTGRWTGPPLRCRMACGVCWHPFGSSRTRVMIPQLGC
eukprot:scaffold4119_cov118-Isochrysis_galbana.AAC.3